MTTGTTAREDPFFQTRQAQATTAVRDATAALRPRLDGVHREYVAA